jgi:hypothetical protein
MDSVFNVSNSNLTQQCCGCEFDRDLVCSSFGRRANSAGWVRLEILRWTRRFCATVILIAVDSLSQETFTIGWHSVGGGGLSSGTLFTVQGTVGQPTTGKMQAERYSLMGGFWSLVAAIQTPDAPMLLITHTNDTVAIFWTGNSFEWVLESTTNSTAAPEAWNPVPKNLCQTNANQVSLTIKRPAGSEYYRLRKPTVTE